MKSEFLSLIKKKKVWVLSISYSQLTILGDILFFPHLHNPVPTYICLPVFMYPPHQASSPIHTLLSDRGLARKGTLCPWRRGLGTCPKVGWRLRDRKLPVAVRLARMDCEIVEDFPSCCQEVFIWKYLPKFICVDFCYFTLGCKRHR